MMRLSALRRLVPAATVAAVFLGGAPVAGAQTAGMYYAPSCGPSTLCSLVRFQFANSTSSSLLINTMTLTATNGTFSFAPSTGGVAIYQAVDGIGPFGGTGTVSVGGGQLFVNFLGGNGFSFELAPGAAGYLEVSLAQKPLLTPAAITYSASLEGGRTIAGPFAVLPEPATLALVGSGLALVGVVGRRRRRA